MHRQIQQDITQHAPCSAIASRTCLMWILALSIIPPPIAAQTTAFSLPAITYTTRDGLAQMQVRSLAKDHYGHIWIGTQNGLSRFDGRQLVSFGAAHGIPQGQILSLAAGPDNRIWGITYTHAFCFDGVSTTVFPQEQADGYPYLIILPSGKAAILRAGVHEVKVFADSVFLPFTTVYPRSRLNAPQMLITDAAGRYMLVQHADSDTLEVMNAAGEHLAFISHSGIGSVMGSRNLPPGYFTTGDPPALMHFSGKDVTPLMAEPPYGMLNSGDDHHLPEFILAASADALLRVYRYHDQRYHSLTGLQLKTPRVLLHDGSELYLGSDEGFTAIALSGWEIREPAPCDNPWTIVQRRGHDKILMACYRDGLLITDSQLRPGRFIPLPADLPLAERQYFPGTTTDPAGHVYFGGFRGFYRFDGGSVVRWPLDETLEALAYDPQTKGIVAAGAALYFADTIPGRFRDALDIPPEVSLGLSCSDLRIHGDDIWLACWGGIAKYDRVHGAWQLYRNADQRFPMDGAFSLASDAAGNLWAAGTNGIARLAPGQEAFNQVLPEMIRDQVSQILWAAKDTLIVVGINEFFALRTSGDPAEVLLRHNYQSGYHILEPNENGAMIDGEGILWVPSIQGIYRYDLHRLRIRDSVRNKIIVERIGNFTVPMSAWEMPACTLRENSTVLQVRVTGRPVNPIMIESSVGGGDWIVAEAPPSVLLQNLRHGQHTVRVRARIPGQPENHWPVTTVNMKVHLPLLQRPFFKLLSGLILAIIVFAVAYAVIQRRKESRRADALQSQLHETKLRTIQAQLNPHFLFNAMTSLQNTIQNHSSEEASEHLVRLSRVIRQVLEFSLQQPEVNTAIPLTSLQKELDLLNDYVTMEQLQHAPGFHFDLRVDDKFKDASPDVPPLLIQPFVENAIHHGLAPLNRRGNILVAISGDNGVIRYRIEDDGIGRRAAQEKQKHKWFQHRSHGVALLRERIQLLNALGFPCTLEVSDRPGGGTIVDIEMTLHT